MLKLQNFQVQLSKRILTQPTNKYLRVSVGSIAKTTSNSAKFISEQSMQWQQALSFPLLYNKQFMFQIYNGHQFGYNSDELQTIMEGKIIIDNITDNKGTWEILINKQPIGYLSAQISSKVPAMFKSVLKQNTINNKKINPQQQTFKNEQVNNKKQTKILKIKTIVVRFPNLSIKKAYITVQVGSQSIKTSQTRSRAGQLVLIQPKQIPIEHNETDARIKICSLKKQQQGQQTNQSEQIMHAEGTLQLIGQKPSKKVILMKDGHEVGEVFIQSKIVQAGELKNNSFASNLNNSKLQNNSQFKSAQEQQQKANAVKPRARSISPSSKSIDFTKLQHFGIDSSRISKPTLFQSSIFSSPSSKRRSVLNQNNNIVFPKQRRFMSYQDKQNQRVSYLVDRSFQYNSSRHGGRYRGASIGYGDKTDFARGKRQNPGVGNYKLPSIWDRY